MKLYVTRQSDMRQTREKIYARHLRILSNSNHRNVALSSLAHGFRLAIVSTVWISFTILVAQSLNVGFLSRTRSPLCGYDEHLCALHAGNYRLKFIDETKWLISELHNPY